MNIAILIGFALKNQTSQESMVEIIDALAELNFAMFIIQNNEKNEPRFVYMNDALCRIMGKKRDELLHLNPFDLAVDEVRDAANFLYRSRQKGGKHPNTYIFTLKTAKGNKKVQMTTNIIEYHQRIATFAILNENIQPGVQPISELVSNHENPSEKATLDE
jgi:PAS domain S-box-containing protein